MAKFDINKKGYDVDQVDSFISKLSLKYEEKLSEQKDRVLSLKNELSVMEERLESYKDKDKQISQALIFAVEKAEQIENNASKLYDLEIKRMRLLYKQWEDLIQQLSSSQLDSGLQKDINNFKQTIDEVISQNNRISGGVIRKDLHNNSDNYIRNLLNKMDYAINSKPTNARKNIVSAMSNETEKENTRLIDLSGKLSSITVEGKGNMADNYLNSDEDTPSIYSKNITRKNSQPKKDDTGFNLEDALNPKEDLDEIMKAFDFFLDEHKDD